MTTCPFCQQTYNSTYPMTNLSRRQQAIYDAVVSGGPKGAPVSSLLKAMYGDEKPRSAWGVMRVNIFEINQKIRERGQRIRGRRDIGYVLVQDRSIIDEPVER
jgi:hypothetical protein